MWGLSSLSYWGCEVVELVDEITRARNVVSSSKFYFETEWENITGRRVAIGFNCSNLNEFANVDVGVKSNSTFISWPKFDEITVYSPFENVFKSRGLCHMLFLGFQFSLCFSNALDCCLRGSLLKEGWTKADQD